MSSAAAHKHQPTATVIPFPTGRRIGKIRRTVEVLSGWQGRRGEMHWQKVIDGMRSQMTAAQIEPDVIDAELLAFEAAVFGRLADFDDAAG